jgi:4-aminobutyrate aminotransferase
MVAAEFTRPGTSEPDADFARRVQALALEHGLILLTCGVSGNVLRFMFPLSIPEPVFDEALGLLRESLTAA